jgi:uncharacterized membrane protein (DUF441 family)
MLQTPTSHPPGRRSITADFPRHNAPAITSLTCAILWPLVVFSVPVWNIATHFAPTPNWLGTLIGFSLAVLPLAGVILATIGLVRSFSQPQFVHSRWQAIVGLIFGVIWVGGYFLLG